MSYLRGNYADKSAMRSVRGGRKEKQGEREDHANLFEPAPKTDSKMVHISALLFAMNCSRVQA